MASVANSFWYWPAQSPRRYWWLYHMHMGGIWEPGLVSQAIPVAILHVDVWHMRTRLYRTISQAIPVAILHEHGWHMRTRLYTTWFFIGDSDEKSKKGTKRKKPPPAAIENDFLPKRRSARVRNGKCLSNLSCYIICIGNSMFCSEIWHKYHEWYFEIVTRKRVKFETTLKCHEWYLCEISHTNHAVICLYHYHCSKPIKLQKFLM